MVCPPLPTGRRRTGISNIRCASQPPPPNGKIVPCGTGNSRAERSRVFKVSCLLLKHCRRVRSLLRAKREPEKAPATFEAREARTRGCSPLVTPKLLGSIQKIQVASLKDFLCSADWKPLSRCATAPSKREPLAKPESVMVCPETLPLCQGLSLWESWQARQGLTERASQLPGAHSKSLIRLPKPCSF